MINDWRDNKNNDIEKFMKRLNEYIHSSGESNLESKKSLMERGYGFCLKIDGDLKEKNLMCKMKLTKTREKNGITFDFLSPDFFCSLKHY